MAELESRVLCRHRFWVQTAGRASTAKGRCIMQDVRPGKTTYVLPPYMVSKALMDAYSAPRLQAARRYVDEQAAHCDDILINEVARAERLVVLCLKHFFGFTVEQTRGRRSREPAYPRQANRTALRTECARWSWNTYFSIRHARPAGWQADRSA